MTATCSIAPAPSRWVLRLAAAAAGAALSLVFPTPSVWWWAWIGLVPILLLVRAAPDPREAVWRSWLAGSGFFTALHWWVLPYLSIFAVPLALLIGVVWVPFGLTTWLLLHPALHASRAGAALAVLPSVWVVTEYLRSWDRLGGSWGFLGLSQWTVPPVLVAAAVGGVWALSALLLVTNVGVTVALAPTATRAARAGAVAVVVVLVATVLGAAALRPEPTVDDELHVGAVQAGQIRRPAVRLAEHERLTHELIRAHPDVDIVVWGQSSVGFDPAQDDEVRTRLLALADDIGRQLVVNIDARRPDGQIAKSTLVVAPGRFGDTYRKQRLVPFGEYIPLRSVLGWVENLTQAADEDRVPGTDVTTLWLAGVPVGPLISYESTFPDMRRALARRGVAMTLVQAAATTFQGTWALPQQGSFEAVRAVESGRPAVLVAVSGTSSAFDPRGRRLAWVPQDESRAWSVRVPLSSERTPFVRWGPWVPLTAAAVTVAAAAVALVGAVRRRCA